MSSNRPRIRSFSPTALRRSLLSVLLLIAFASGCRKYSDTITDPPDGSVTTSIAGRVTDESNNPIAGAQVVAGSRTVTTDANGLFSIPDVSTNGSRTYVIVKKPGFFNGARAAVPCKNGVTYMQLSLATDAIAGNVSSTTGGSVTFGTGARIKIVAGGVVTSSGAPYTGTVTVHAKHLNPTSPSFANLFQGDLAARTSEGKETELLSYGVIVAELRGSNGELLQPAPNFPAVLTYPVASSMLATAPATMPLWYFDESIGMWHEEGSAMLSGSVYTGTVQHFSAWNCDYQGPWGVIKGRIVCGGIPIPKVVVSLGVLSVGGQPTVITNGNGEFEARVPAGTNFVELQVLAGNNNGLHFTNAPFKPNVVQDQVTDLGDITLDSKCPAFMSGTLKDCNGEPIPGMVLASWQGNLTYAYTQNGKFTLVLPENTPVTLSATANNGKLAQPQPFTSPASGSTSSSVDVLACDGSNEVRTDVSGSFDGSVAEFSPDGSKLAVLDATMRGVYILDVASGNTLATIPNAFPADRSMKSIQFSADGSRLMTCSSSGYANGGFQVWNTDGTLITPVEVQANMALLLPNGTQAIRGTVGTSYVETIDLYDIASGTSIKTFSLGTLYSYYTILCGLINNGSDFVVNGLNQRTTTLTSWSIANDAATGTMGLPMLPDGKDSIANTRGLRFSPDGSIMGHAGYASMMFYQWPAGTVLGNLSEPPCNYSFGIHPDDQHFLALYRTTSGATSVSLSKISDGSPVHLFSAPASFGPGSGVALSRDGKLAAGVYQNGIRIWNVN